MARMKLLLKGHQNLLGDPGCRMIIGPWFRLINSCFELIPTVKTTFRAVFWPGTISHILTVSNLMNASTKRQGLCGALQGSMRAIWER